MGKTRIEWATRVWNPVTGCSPISEGCENCYALRMATRFAGHGGYPADHPFAVTLHKDKLEEPLRWKTPQRVFVCSMGDLFHEDVPGAWLIKIWGVMAQCPQHTFLILTKRPERMHRFVSTLFDPSLPRGPDQTYNIVLPNVWLGVTAENQARADERIPILLQTPAAKRFVSCEPLLGPITFRPQARDLFEMHELSVTGDGTKPLMLRGIDWLIAGGESGPGARPMHPGWARYLRDQCQEIGVPFFFKQWGEWTTDVPQGLSMAHREMALEQGQTFYRVGKKCAGRLLDGLEWNEVPKVPA